MTSFISINLESVKAILFDLDNTLIMTRNGDTQACELIVHNLIEKYEINVDIANSIVGSFLTKFRICPHNTKVSLHEWRLGLWSDVLPDNLKHIAGAIYDLWLQFRYECLKPSKLIIAMLKQLREHYALALITNGTSEHQWEKIHRLKMEKYFDCVLVSGDLPWEKPNPSIFYKACQILSVKPSESIMIGDKIETDILGGIEANLNSNFLLTKSSKKSSNKLSYYVINDILELNKYLIPSKLSSITSPHCENASDVSLYRGDSSDDTFIFTCPLKNNNVSYVKMNFSDVDESSCSSSASR